MPGYVFDTVTKFRFDRLDVVFKTGEYNDYKKAFREYLEADKVYLQAMAEEDLVGTFFEGSDAVVETSERLNNVYDWLKEIDKLPESIDPSGDFIVELVKDTVTYKDFTKELDDFIGGVENIALAVEVIDYLHTFMNQVEDHHAMLDAVYDIEDRAITEIDPERQAAKNIYDLYDQDVLSKISEVLEKSVKIKGGLNFMGGKFGIYQLTAAIAGEALEIVIPGDSEKVSLLPVHANVVMSAKSRANVPHLDTVEETNDYRLSLILALIASKECYETMAEQERRYGDTLTYYESKVRQIEERLMGLYLIAENVKFDSYENYETFAKDNRKRLK